mgnify:CR=1 FL=1
MKETITLLNHIYQMCELILTKFEPILKEVEDVEFKSEVKREKALFEEIKYLADGLLASLKEEEKVPGKIHKFSSYLSTKLSTLTNNEPRHISNVMLEGEREYQKDIQEKIHACPKADVSVIELATRLNHTLEENIQVLKKWTK